MSERTITLDNFDQEVSKSALPVLLDFWAPWCVYCRSIEPAVKALAEEMEGTLALGKVNIDEQPELAERFRVETIPSLILFRDGEETGERLVAPVSRDAIEEWLEENGFVI